MIIVGVGCLIPSRGGRRIALAAIPLSPPSDAGVQFLPGLKAGASSRIPGEGTPADRTVCVGVQGRARHPPAGQRPLHADRHDRHLRPPPPRRPAAVV